MTLSDQAVESVMCNKGCPFMLLHNSRNIRRSIHSDGLVCWSCHNKIPQTGGLKQQQSTFPQFWRLEVKDQGVGSFGFFWGLSPWLAHGLLTVLTRCSGVSFSSYKDNSHWIRARPLWSHLTLIPPKAKYNLIGLGFVLGRLIEDRGTTTYRHSPRVCWQSEVG